MEKLLQTQTNTRRLPEYSIFDGECYINLYLLDVNADGKIATVAIEDRGKISVLDYDLLWDNNHNLYFEYGIYYQKIKIHEFE